MKKMSKLLLSVCFFAGTITASVAQVKIGDNPGTINGNSIFELEDSAKGTLLTRVKINDLNSPAPLTAPVPEGMLVYSDSGAVTDGFYYWNGNKWASLETKNTNLVTKTASATLTKTETMVLASNDITLTLPAISANDNGLTITVKNMGSYKDEVVVTGGTGIKIDNKNNVRLSRWGTETFIASGGNWILKNRQLTLDNTYNVDYNGSWRTIKEVLEFLKEHIHEPSTVQLCGGTFSISETQVIDLPYRVMFQGSADGSSIITAASGLGNSPMFRCKTNCDFMSVVFDGSTLANYGNNPGEDAVRFVGSNTENKIKDCDFKHFNKSVVDSASAKIWMFGTNFEESVYAGIEISSETDSLTFKMSEVDFVNCARGVVYNKGTNVISSINNCGFYNSQSADTAVIYRPATFSFSSMFFTGNIWNNIGKNIMGFDFTRTDGRDADVYIKNNIGIEDKNAHAKISVSGNTLTTAISNAGTWYKANWTNTNEYTCNFQITNNNVKYLPPNEVNAWCVITGNITCSNPNKVVHIGIVKNDDIPGRWGETDLRIVTANQPFQFSTVIYIDDLEKNDYLELYCTSNGNGDIITFQDVQWFIETR